MNDIEELLRESLQSTPTPQTRVTDPVATISAAPAGSAPSSPVAPPRRCHRRCSDRRTASAVQPERRPQQARRADNDAPPSQPPGSTSTPPPAGPPRLSSRGRRRWLPLGPANGPNSSSGQFVRRPGGPQHARSAAPLDGPAARDFCPTGSGGCGSGVAATAAIGTVVPSVDPTTASVVLDAPRGR